MIISTLRILCFGVSICFTQIAFAQNFPNKPIRIIVPFAPGGSADIIARAVGDALGRQMGQPVIIDSRGVIALVGTGSVSFTVTQAVHGSYLAQTKTANLAVKIRQYNSRNGRMWIPDPPIMRPEVR